MINKQILLTVCRLDPHKGVDWMLKSVPSLKKSFPNINYVIIGDGPERSNLEKMAFTLGIRQNIRFLGYIEESELATWYNLCDVYVMLSNELPGRTDLIEGFGISFVEAAACGKPCVGCRF